MNKRAAMQWIVDEVDDLVASGVLSAESGEALRRHYGQQLAQPETGGRVVLLSVLGAALIGAGVILLIAHNWDDLGRPARTVLSLLPLLVSGAISLFALLRRGDSVAWRESAGVAQTAGVAASIALVSQTYHISGELSDFLFTWLVLTLPLPYLLRAVMPALVYLAGIAVWAGNVADTHSGAAGYWLFLAAILPFYAGVLRGDRLGKAAGWLSVFVGASAALGMLFTFTEHPSPGLWIPGFAGLFGTLYLAGALGFPELRHAPLRVLGGLGMVVLTLVLSFKPMWHGIHAAEWKNVGWTGFAVAGFFSLLGLGLMARGFLRKADFNRTAALFPAVGLAGYAIAFLPEATRDVTGALLLNFYGFALALGTAFRGLRQRTALTLNGGLLLFAALIFSRFVDSEFGIVERGVAFILLGALVLGANLWMLKSRKEGAV